MKVKLNYWGIDCKGYFDIINLDGYDLILRTLFMFQHKVVIRLNDLKVIQAHCLYKEETLYSFPPELWTFWRGRWREHKQS